MGIFLDTILPARVPEPESIAVGSRVVEEVPSEEYAALAARLGVVYEPPLARFDLLSVLREEGCRIYDMRAVELWMNKKARYALPTVPHKSRISFKWAWLPLRSKDWPASNGISTLGTGNPLKLGVLSLLAYSGNLVYGQNYDKTVPYPVLLTVERLSKYPEIKFFVADIVAVSKPDPFLAVAVEPMDQFYVIERWDEPGFRG